MNEVTIFCLYPCANANQTNARDLEDNQVFLLNIYNYIMARQGTIMLDMSQEAHQAWAYPSFCSMKRLGVFLFSLGWELTIVYCRIVLSIELVGTHFTLVERGTVRVHSVSPKSTAQCSRLGLKPTPLDLETSSLAVRPPWLPIFGT